MVAELKTHHERCEALHEERTDLAEQLRETAQSLVSLSPEDLDPVLVRMQDFSERLQALIQDAGDLLDRHLDTDSSHQDDESALGIDSLRIAIRTEEELRGRKALFENLLAIESVSEQFREEARAVLDIVRGNIESLQEINQADAIPSPDSDHPLAALLRMIGKGNELSNDEWNRDYHILQHAWGRSIAATVARERLKCDSLNLNELIESENAS